MQFHRRVLARTTSAALAVCLATLPIPALATQTPGEEAESLYNEGRGLYETADYEGAIKLWTKAYTKLEWSLDNAEIKVGLLYNLAGAHEEAFGINNNATHLNKALVLLKRFEENIPKIYGEGADADAERQRVQERRDRLQAKLDEAKASGVKERDIDEAVDEAEDQTEDEPKDETPVEETPPDDGKDDKSPGKALIISGAVVAGLGVATGAAAIGTAIAGDRANDFSGLDPEDYDGRLQQIDRGENMNTVAVANAIAGGVLIIGGVVLLAIGVKKKNAAGGKTATLAPSFGRSQAGLVLSGRF